MFREIRSKSGTGIEVNNIYLFLEFTKDFAHSAIEMSLRNAANGKVDVRRFMIRFRLARRAEQIYLSRTMALENYYRSIDKLLDSCTRILSHISLLILMPAYDDDLGHP